MDTTRPVTVTCDTCTSAFQIRNHAELMKGGEMQYFVCPHCGRRYDYAFVTLEGVRLREMLRSLRALRRQHDSAKLRTLHDNTLAAYQKEVHRPNPPTSHLP